MTVTLMLDVYVSYYIKWLSLIREVLPLLFMDNAGYQKSHLVQNLAQELKIELLFFPPSLSQELHCYCY